MSGKCLSLYSHVAERHLLKPCNDGSAHCSMARTNGRLTAIDRLGSLLLLLASVVLSGLLDGKTSLGAGNVKGAAVVHSLLQGVGFPAKDVVTVGGGTTRRYRVSQLFKVYGA
jgi:hypothetical protein